VRRALLGVLIAICLAGCVPVASAPPGFTNADGHAAVDQAFDRFGPVVVACAHGVAHNESNEWPYSNNGTHFGMFQLHRGFQGSINAAAAALGREASFFDPYVNAWAASMAFEAHGSFRYNWPQTTPAGCP